MVAIYDSDFITDYIDSQGKYLDDDSIVPIPVLKSKPRGKSRPKSSPSPAANFNVRQSSLDDEEPDDWCPEPDGDAGGDSDRRDGSEHDGGQLGEDFEEDEGSCGQDDNDIMSHSSPSMDLPQTMTNDQRNRSPSVLSSQASDQTLPDRNTRSRSVSTAPSSFTPPPSLTPSSTRASTATATPPPSMPMIPEDDTNPFATITSEWEDDESLESVDLSTQPPSWALESLSRRHQFLKSLCPRPSFATLVAWLETHQVFICDRSRTCCLSSH